MKHLLSRSILAIYFGFSALLFNLISCTAVEKSINNITYVGEERLDWKDDNVRNQFDGGNLKNVSLEYAPTIPNKSRQKRQTKKRIEKVECGPSRDHTQLMYVRTDSINKYTWKERLTYDLTQQVSAIRICSPGYSIYQYSGTNSCLPFCNRCGQGECMAPDVCKCYSDFERNPEGVCTSVCPLGCYHGYCDLLKGCSCYEGYQLDKTKKFCLPICADGCGHDPRMKCISPRVCDCIEGFSMVDGICKPQCNPDCGPGGECKAFGLTSKCACYPGYKLRKGVCESDCYQTCANGICYNRHTCHCYSDYIYNEYTRNCEARVGIIERYSFNF
ncbi:epidermal growth factor-like protein isoform X1 [Stomoxys calcitrans]|uniref:epidermal growth factor-like protein isoform X1 n=1 Tax=Stomoxys calcitrans TaxID=35570 RepID=UPI0027E37F09|nr:epidermal growth factor-like protein isoform X1 [Stomoxys calcitrans]